MSFWEFLSSRRELLLFEFYQHASMVTQCVLAATALGILIGIATYRQPGLAAFATGTAGVLFTIPSFALFGLLIPIFGLGVAPAVVALTLYALLPIMRNCIVGLGSVDKNMLEAARGMGMSRTARMFRVTLPLAWPVILTGMRVSTQLVLGVGAIAAYVSGPGLGAPIFSGLARLGGANALNSVLAGTLGVVILALLFDALYVLIGRLTTPRGIRV